MCEMLIQCCAEMSCWNTNSSGYKVHKQHKREQIKLKIRTLSNNTTKLPPQFIHLNKPHHRQGENTAESQSQRLRKINKQQSKMNRKIKNLDSAVFGVERILNLSKQEWRKYPDPLQHFTNKVHISSLLCLSQTMKAKATRCLFAMIRR